MSHTSDVHPGPQTDPRELRGEDGAQVKEIEKQARQVAEEGVFNHDRHRGAHRLEAREEEVGKKQGRSRVALNGAWTAPNPPEDSIRRSLKQDREQIVPDSDVLEVVGNDFEFLFTHG